MKTKRKLMILLGVHWLSYGFAVCRPMLAGYARMLIVVAFLVVNFFSFLVIAPSHQLQSGRK